MDDTTTPIADPNAPPPPAEPSTQPEPMSGAESYLAQQLASNNAETIARQQPPPAVVATDAAPLPEPQVDAFGLPPVAAPAVETASAEPTPAAPDLIERAEETIERFIAPRHPDDAFARIAEILDNMHGSDDQRRKVVQAIVGRFGG